MNDDGIDIEIEIAEDNAQIEGVETEIDILKEYPELEDIVITPTLEQQQFKSDKYGFENVIVNAINAKELRIEPSKEKQITEGIFNKVIVGPIQGDTLNVTPSKEAQSFVGLFDEVNVNAIENMVDTRDATATSSQILSGTTAYVNNEKISGTIEIYNGDYSRNEVI